MLAQGDVKKEKEDNNMNRINITGQIVNTPQLSFVAETPGMLCRFMVVSNREKAVFPCVCFGDTANEIYKSFGKGSQVALSGMLRDYNYRDCNMTIHYSKVLVVCAFEKSMNCSDDYEEKNISYYDKMMKEGYALFDSSELEVEVYEQLCKKDSGECYVVGEN
jgi:single-stranded DNA-binding protein